MSPLQAMILDFEKQWFRRAGEKEAEIMETFSMTAVTYYRHLNDLLDEPEALATEPVVVNRLRRIRDSRARMRRAG